ncbi:hypothetical protein ACGFIU_24935 [Rhodococcus oryzae]|uniref:hypothetical protein n=1 Tax=Rhodococcus oryzae TaxID=2571143 RepID=UPI00371820E8
MADFGGIWDSCGRAADEVGRYSKRTSRAVCQISLALQVQPMDLSVEAEDRGGLSGALLRVSDMNDGLNEFATQIGYTVNEKEGVWRVSRGRPGSQKLVQAFPNIETAKGWLEERAQRVVWNLDLEDPAISVRNPNGTGITTVVEITDQAMPDIGPLTISGGVCASLPSGEISSFYVQTTEPPALGFWYR